MNLLAESYVQAYERQWRIEEGECHQRLVAMLPPDPQRKPHLATLWHGIRSRLSRATAILPNFPWIRFPAGLPAN